MSDFSQTSSPTVEEACAKVVQAADDLNALAKKLLAASSALRKAAMVGNSGAIAAQSQALADIGPLVADGARTASRSWAFSPDSLSSYMDTGYRSELTSRSASLGVTLDSLEDRFVAFPVVVEVQGKARAVKLNGKRAAGVRPSFLAQQIKALQAKSGSKPEQFIELLYSAAVRVNRQNLGVSGVLLNDVFEVLTLHPEAKKAYSRADFARDLYSLQTSNVKRTKKGAEVSFPGATGTRGDGKIFTVIGPDRYPRHYVGVRFEENNA
jgi:hypothetical protein